MDIQEKIQWLENELEEIKKEVEKQEEKGKTWNTWQPWEGEDFSYIDEDGEVHEDYMDVYHESKYRIGNMFKSEEDAEFMVERLRVIQELKQFARPFKQGEENYFMYYHHNYDRINIDCFVRRQQNELYFESEEIAQKAIKTVGEERIKEYYLQVKED